MKRKECRFWILHFLSATSPSHDFAFIALFNDYVIVLIVMQSSHCGPIFSVYAASVSSIGEKNIHVRVWG